MCSQGYSEQEEHSSIFRSRAHSLIEQSGSPQPPRQLLQVIPVRLNSPRAAQNSLKLEEMGRQGEFDGSDKVFKVLASEIASLERTLLDLVKEVTI